MDEAKLDRVLTKLEAYLDQTTKNTEMQERESRMRLDLLLRQMDISLARLKDGPAVVLSVI